MNEEEQKKRYAIEFARKGGKARKAKRTPEELSAWGKKANKARIKKYGLKRKKKKAK